ncbi:metal-response element-binding transcription factor 2-like [Nilaparvata lugens]|uniref:metal-response element-binding transcription factor 2-like n=1 Tax=Nilaparvata lugens TaxID=108931 RepID=UPI00193DDC94|nr:metal-response element-binding transcription factor 2-like [Nilaparvata lugens]
MSAKHRKESSYETESSTAPDSTTREKLGFSIGDEVLLNRKDGNFYLGTVVELDNVREQCLIKFDDNTSSWSHVKHMTRLFPMGDGFDDDVVMCVVCKQSEPQATIVVCNRCARGYHQLCHQPAISSDSIRKWQCRRCQVPLIDELRAYRKKAKTKAASPTKKTASAAPNAAVDAPNTVADAPNAAAVQLRSSGQQENAQLQPESNPRLQLPYDLKSLVWDEQHEVNSQQKYCYCGSSGDWYLKMLQCSQCRQWFHERCVSCLQYPLYLGDRFYVFVCGVCNVGVEFARRLEVGWVDLVHLALFNMTVCRAEEYHHIDQHINYFINCNWTSLQLPPKISKVWPKERKTIITNVLLKNSSRFKSARELKKSSPLWGLRMRVPPPPPLVPRLPTLPTTTPLTEQRLLNANPTCKFLPHRPVASPQKTDVKNHVNQSNHNHNGEIVEGILPKAWRSDKVQAGIKMLHIDARPLLLPKGMPATGHKVFQFFFIYRLSMKELCGFVRSYFRDWTQRSEFIRIVQILYRLQFSSDSL